MRVFDLFKGNKKGKGKASGRPLVPSKSTTDAYGSNSCRDSRLFALVIGIDEYPNLENSDLRAGKEDANKVSNFLENYLAVSPRRIINLRDKEATSRRIIKEIEALGNNSSIRHDDPIIIYYAGHGAELVPTEKHAGSKFNFEVDGTGRIQMLMPYDVSVDPNRRDGEPIYDFVFSHMLSRISEKKGNNITVILDCCHSASGTRTISGDDTFQTRRIILPNDYTIKGEPYARILRSPSSEFTGSRAIAALSLGFGSPRTMSHVLLAACKSDQAAVEDKRKKEGAFTKALIDALCALHGLGDTTYEGLMTQLRPLNNQNPQCEGENRGRKLFKDKVSIHSSEIYTITRASTSERLSMKAGSIQDIRQGTKFDTYSDMPCMSDCLGQLSAASVHRLSTTLQYDGSHPFTFPADNIAFCKQRSSEGVILPFDASRALVLNVDKRVEIQMKEVAARKHMSSILQSGQVTVRGIHEEAGDIQLEYSDKKTILLHIVDCNRARFTRDSSFSSYDLDYDVIESTLRGIARYYHFLRHRGPDNLTESVEIECFEVTSIVQSVSLGKVCSTIGENLIRNNELRLNGVENHKTSDSMEYRRLGFTIRSRTTRPLHVALFYFDNTDFSITSVFKGHSASRTPGEVEAPLPPLKCVHIGHDSSVLHPVQLYLRDAENEDFGYFKLYITTSHVHLGHIPQQKVLGDDGYRPIDIGNDNDASSLWGTVLVPVTLRRDWDG